MSFTGYFGLMSKLNFQFIFPLQYLYVMKQMINVKQGICVSLLSITNK